MKIRYSDILKEAAASAIAYLEGIDDRPVYPTAADCARLAELAGPLPDGRRDDREVLRALSDVAARATVASAGSRYFGFVVGGTLPAALASDWLVSAWDQTASSWKNSPATAKLEAIAATWLVDLFGLPPKSLVGFPTTTTMGNVVGLAAARTHLLARLGYDVEERGLFGAPELRVVVSEEAHITLFKALAILGLGRARVERVPVDEQGRLRAEALPELDERSIVCLQAGNVNSGAFDPFGEVCQVARSRGAWVHVDGAFGLWARVSAGKRHLLAGVEEADSWVTDGHKWLNTPYDGAIVICRHRESMTRAMATQAAYFPDSDDVAAKDLVPEFSRRARGVPIWAALYGLGKRGIEALVDRCCQHAVHFADGLRKLGVEVLNDVVLNQVVATHGDREDVERLLQRIEEDGTMWMGPTKWRGRHGFRISVSSWRTDSADVERSLAAIAKALSG